MRGSIDKFESMQSGTSGEPAVVVLLIISTALAIITSALIWRLRKSKKELESQMSLANERERDILKQIANWQAVYRKREEDLRGQLEDWQAAYKAMQEETSTARERYRNHLSSGILSLEQMQNLPPRIFEETIAYNMRLKGYLNVQLTGGPGDLGADITGIDPSGRRVIVQCKRYSSSQKIGTPDLTHFLGAKNIHQAERLIFVTTSSFTLPAKQLATSHGIELLEGTNLNWRLRMMATGF